MKQYKWNIKQSHLSIPADLNSLVVIPWVENVLGLTWSAAVRYLKVSRALDREDENDEAISQEGLGEFGLIPSWRRKGRAIQDARPEPKSKKNYWKKRDYPKASLWPGRRHLCCGW
ncbi:hypothetical protein XENOCAPTIV_009191 [Xenoophorus captivus]|uniref:Uncharacterized protein n=1 Tax=Xenoophorus captivus TaxID=1517983 RepID=A0ABV0S7B4_9TELE